MFLHNVLYCIVMYTPTSQVRLNHPEPNSLQFEAHYLTEMHEEASDCVQIHIRADHHSINLCLTAAYCPL
jgi:hypothetical protein